MQIISNTFVYLFMPLTCHKTKKNTGIHIHITNTIYIHTSSKINLANKCKFAFHTIKTLFLISYLGQLFSTVKDDRFILQQCWNAFKTRQICCLEKTYFTNIKFHGLTAMFIEAANSSNIDALL